MQRIESAPLLVAAIMLATVGCLTACATSPTLYVFQRPCSVLNSIGSCYEVRDVYALPHDEILGRAALAGYECSERKCTKTIHVGEQETFAEVAGESSMSELKITVHKSKAVSFEEAKSLLARAYVAAHLELGSPQSMDAGVNGGGCGPGQVWVSGYTRKNGTRVRGYCRSK